ncbi:uncharacterized protein [Dysidea avara]|uniref:uncharacterized protein isoform X2 n=1 Tax=Dysidea avara TaxID=196820 RepID=UPI003322153E
MPWWGSNKPKPLETAEFHIIDDVKIIPTTLGRGSYGTVKAAVFNGKPCVAKEIHPHFAIVTADNPTPLDAFIKEINTLSSLRHPSIVQFLGVYFKENSHVPILVMERMWKNLSILLEEQPKQLPLLTKVHILYDVACGLQYLHGQKKPVVHRDLNANNILLNDNMDAKIADLGQAKALVSINTQKMSTEPGNIAHMPPEALKHEAAYYDSKLDIFSFGCTIIHLVTEKFPQPTNQYVPFEKNTFIRQSEVERRIEFITQMSSSDYNRLQQIAIQCLYDVANGRPTASHICDYLKQHSKELEEKSPLVKQFKQNKFCLLEKLQSQGTELESAKKLNERLQEEKESLKRQLDEQNEITTTYKHHTDRLKAEVEEKQYQIEVTDAKIVELQQKVQNLHIKCESDAAALSEKNIKIIDLDELIQKATNAIGVLEQKNNISKANKEDLIKTNSGLMHELTEIKEKYKLLQITSKKQQDEISYLRSDQRGKVITNTESNLHQMLLELQHVNEKEHQQLQRQRQSYFDNISHFNGLIAQLSATKNYAAQKQQLEDISNQFNTLESSVNQRQETLHSKEEKLKSIGKIDATLHKLPENNSVLYKKLQKECDDKDEPLKRKDTELQMQKKEHADEISKLKNQHLREIQSLVEEHNIYLSQTAKQREATELLKEEVQCRLDLIKNTEEKLKQLENELKVSNTIQKDLKRQIKQYEKIVKEKVKRINDLEETNCLKHSNLFDFDIQWFAHLSLPVKRIKPSATIVKDKVFVSGGYQHDSPQGKTLDFIWESVENDNEVFCFHTTKCRCDSIVSPVVLGGVASVNGQCVLVSGAEGNTLTGNVYVLCEEGSDEQWKKFSEPVPTPRILPCVCCYQGKWLIVCGGYTCKEGSNLLEAVNVMEILDISKGEWYTLPDEKCPGVSTVHCCTVVTENLYIIGDGKFFKNNFNKVITAVTRKSASIPQWSDVDMQIEEVGGNLHPFSVVDVNGELMIIASISGSEDDVTCVLMKDTTDTWRKMSEAIECQHCSGVVVTPTLELFLFGGSEKVSKNKATDISQCGALTPNLDALDHVIHHKNEEYIKDIPANSTFHVQEDTLDGAVNRPPYVSFTGPIHTKQFDHKGGTFQSPVHKVLIVVPPNAIDDGEKVTVHMGATTSGPFDLPEDCKLRSAVVWLSSGCDVVLKRSIAVVVPHSAVFTSPQHHSMMRFLTCEDCEGPRYKFGYSSIDCFEIDENQGWIELHRFSLVAIAASSDSRQTNHESHETLEYHNTVKIFETPCAPEMHQQQTSVKGKTPSMPPGRYLAKLFWPRGQLPNSFRADIFCLQNIPTEIYKVNTLYRKAYYEDNGTYPEIVETEFMINGDGTELKCILPCSGSSECDCLSGWDVTQMSDINEVHIEKSKKHYPEYKIGPKKWSFKFACYQPKVALTCCFAFQGGEQIVKSNATQIPFCLQKRLMFWAKNGYHLIKIT